MTQFQSTDEFNELLEGRTLRFILTGSESKSGRPLSAAFQDVESGEAIALMAISGALQAWSRSPTGLTRRKPAERSQRTGWRARTPGRRNATQHISRHR